ncbi:MAG: DUF4302 domain-containing protein [Bacteroidales bacterium]|nr:DUF4302 domain-containing protein [Bacteroidales bacterium]
MKKLLISLTLTSLIMVGCYHNQEDYFDESASERITANLTKSKQMLESAENGWRVAYYPNPSQIFGGYNVFFKFKEGNVTIMTDVAGPDKTCTSLYSMGEDLGPTLNLDTKNELINYFCHPKNPDGLGSSYKGMEGDYLFTVMEASEEKVVLRGTKSGNTYVLTPLETSDWKTEMQAYLDASEDMAFNTYNCVVNGKTYSIKSSYRTFQIDVDGETISVPFIYNKDGISFYKPITIDGVTAQNFTFKDEYHFDAADGADFKIMTPAPVKSDLKIELSVPSDEMTYNSVVVSGKPSNDEEYYYMGVMTLDSYKSLREKKLISKLVGELNNYISATIDAETVANTLLYKGEKNDTYKYLSYYDKYVAVSFGCAIVDGFIAPTTSMTAVEFSMNPDLIPSTATDDYKAWLGQWEITTAGSETTNTKYTFVVTVKPNVINSSYKVTGWSYASIRNDFNVNATYYSSTKAMRFAGDQSIYDYGDGYILKYRNRYQNLNTLARGILGSTNVANMVALMETDGNATATGRVGTLSGGVPFQVTCLEFYDVLGTTNYYVAAAAEFVYTDFFFGPYTMKRIVGLNGASNASLQKLNSKQIVDIQTIPSVKRQSSLPFYLMKSVSNDVEESEVLE